jgi:hypothetical protein
VSDYCGPPEGGGFLVLNQAQLGDLDLVCLIRRTFPQTKIFAQQPMPALPELHWREQVMADLAAAYRRCR